MTAVIKPIETRTYNRSDCITFRKTAEKFGGLSNMAGGYLLNVNGVRILTSEALYQCCRFPHLPEVQRQIISERSPMTAKMKSKPYRSDSRPDWNVIQTKVMRWCLQVKLVQNWDQFSKLLLETEDLLIVEDSRKDDFWGAKPINEDTLIGANVLGRLLMQLRAQIKNGEISPQSIINPLPVADFLLYQQQINSISKDGEYKLANNNYAANPVDLELSLLNVSEHKLDANAENRSNSAAQVLTAAAGLDFDKCDSLQFVLLPIIEQLQEAERTDKELAELFKTNLAQMREWLNRAVQLHKIKKLSKPVRYVAESQLFLS
jgi:ribA/ribD-fused uncharacterized protein